jgi:glycosyltransferase involved in cell wall biosynthesis
LARQGLRTARQLDVVQSEAPSDQAEAFRADYRLVHQLPEQTDAQIADKALQYGSLVSKYRADRARLWRELARLESLRQNSLVAATYRLRAMRLAGEDRFHDISLVKTALEQSGYGREAEVADAMFGGHPDRDERCARLLEEAYQRHRRVQELPYELVDDRRPDGGQRLASVIVSLYDAADKLPMFLRALSLQTILAAGKAEVILVDSGSPGNEYAVFKQMAEELKIPLLYARSAQRETIQSAWNRGIGLSRGKYLSFLGVDEAILPTTLETLARELEADPALDWVQADSIVTNVDAQGQWLSDVMVYDRSGYLQQLVYLETCYLSWVGALYRRDIHERFGYYDASFGAAGDTEFKGRVLPFIKTKHLPQTLGIFWNYPSGQTTCSPRAEIEDLRAWYLHRTLAGVRYAFGGRTRADAEELLYATLRYRKSYCRHWSTDVEYAVNLAQFLKEQRPDAATEAMHAGLADLLGAYRSLDFLAKASPDSLAWSLSRARHVARRVEGEHFRLSGERIRPAYEVFNDNRHEQHANLWWKAA